MHKGQAGRIGIIGGSLEYSGAPFYAGIAALKTGCGKISSKLLFFILKSVFSDLVHIFCQQSAALPIKSYSPELIVHPILDSENPIDLIEQELTFTLLRNIIIHCHFRPWLSRLHVIVIGSGLGRDRKILQTVSEIIMCCQKSQKPLVIDADGLFLITQNFSLLEDYKNVILTPNAMELQRLIGDSSDKLQTLAEKLGHHAVILEKAVNDRIYDTKQMIEVECPAGGSDRRCGGQGDLLAGSLATFYHWSLNFQPGAESENENIEESPTVLACYAASLLIKHSNKLAWQKLGRSMTAHDMIPFIHEAFCDLKFEK